MLIADINPITKNIHIQGKLNEELKNSLRDLGWRKVKNRPEMSASYDIFLLTEPTLPKLWKSPDLIKYLNDLLTSYNPEDIDLFLNETCPVKLYPFQREFVHWYNDASKTNKAAFNACEPGLGKSVMALAAVLYSNPDENLVILCPKNAISVWKHHLSMFRIQEGYTIFFFSKRRSLYFHI